MDRIDRDLLLALIDDHRATVMALAERAGVARNTVQSRLARYRHHGVIRSLDRCIDPAALGYPLAAVIMISVTQRRLDEVAVQLEQIPEVLEVVGISGSIDMIARVAAKDADDLYRVAGRVLAVDGVERTETALQMREMVPFRLAGLLRG